MAITGGVAEAVELFAEKARRPPIEFEVVARFAATDGYAMPVLGRDPVPGEWHDFADPATGVYGQCKRAQDGSWIQPPRGDAPVVLAWHRDGVPPSSAPATSVRRRTS